MSQQFNREDFGALVNSAIGNTKKREFASSIDVTPEYLSRIINAKLANPPSIKVIRLISSHAANGVTYSDLMAAAGYDVPSDAAPVNATTISADDQKYIQGTILNALSSNRITCTLEQQNEDTAFNLSVSFQNGAISKWYFYFLVNATEDQISKNLYSLYTQLIFANLSTTDKISFVTSSKEEYQYYLDHPPVNLNLNLSVILIDKKELTIQTESWLHSTDAISDADISLYTL